MAIVRKKPSSATINNFRPYHEVAQDPVSIEITSTTGPKANFFDRQDVRRLCGMFLIYGFVSFALCLNVYVLLNRHDTIFYLRLYQLLVAFIMLVTIGVMMQFMWYARHRVAKLHRSHTLPRPMLFSGFLLTVGITLGYAYFIVFNLTFRDCDQLVDTQDQNDVMMEIIYEATMICFCVICFIYLMQRSHYGTLNKNSDHLRRLWINASVCIVWLQVVVNKGYVSHQDLCKRKKLVGYWCPVAPHEYQCDVEQLSGTREVWYYLNKGLLSSAIIACASEFFPVVLVAHWLVCGGAEERAEDLLRRQRVGFSYSKYWLIIFFQTGYAIICLRGNIAIKQKKSVRRVLQRFIADMSRVVGGKPKPLPMPPLITAAWVQSLLIIFALITTVLVLGQWFVRFYCTILFDKVHAEHFMLDHYVFILVGTVQILFHSLVYYWAAKVEERRFDAYHKAEARGDVVLILGCCILSTVKFILQIVEMDYQKIDGFISQSDLMMRIYGLLANTISQWMQFMSLRRILSLGDRDLRSSRRFLPSVAIASFSVNVVNFGLTYFDTTIIKYQIGKEEDFGFSAATLMSMIVTQTLYPADYLYAFTVAGCWMDLIYRFTRMGYFELGAPTLDRQVEWDRNERELHCKRRKGGKRHSLPAIACNRCDSL